MRILLLGVAVWVVDVPHSLRLLGAAVHLVQLSNPSTQPRTEGRTLPFLPTL